MRTPTTTVFAALTLGAACLAAPVAGSATNPVALVDRTPGAVYQRAGAPRATHAFTFYYQYAPAGWRYWSQRDESTWTEGYDSGDVTVFHVLGRIRVDGDAGTLVLRADGRLEVYIPDRGSHMMWARFRSPGGTWAFLGQMTDVM